METYKFNLCGSETVIAISIEAKDLATAFAEARRQVREVHEYSHSTRIMHGLGSYNP